MRVREKEKERNTIFEFRCKQLQKKCQNGLAILFILKVDKNEWILNFMCTQAKQLRIKVLNDAKWQFLATRTKQFYNLMAQHINMKSFFRHYFHSPFNGN